MKRALLLIVSIFPCFAQQPMENLGEAINTRYDELAPVISPDGKTLYFIRGNRDDNRTSTSYRIMMSQRSAQGWERAIDMPAPFNLRSGVNMMHGMTADGRSILISGSETSSGFDGAGFSLITRSTNEGGWGRPVKLPIRSYDALLSSAGASSTADVLAVSTKRVPTAFLAADGVTLLLSIFSEEEARFELYVSHLSNSEWTAPRNLGSTVNSEFNDITPFFAADGRTLYFASDRNGNYDIFMTKRLDDTWRRWSPPVNLGAPINTDGWEGYFSTDRGGEYAYVVSYKNSMGKGDIVRVKLDPRFRPGSETIVTTVDASIVVSRPTPTRFNDDLKSAYDAIMSRVQKINNTVDDINTRSKDIKVKGE
ncbi:MAG: hypothetical protein AABZ39_07595 [Spirochaetota bacterium]